MQSNLSQENYEVTVTHGNVTQTLVDGKVVLTTTNYTETLSALSSATYLTKVKADYEAEQALLTDLQTPASQADIAAQAAKVAEKQALCEALNIQV